MQGIMEEKEFKKLVRKWLKNVGLTYPWIVNLGFQRPVDEDDAECYAACSGKADYMTVNLHFDLLHGGWESKESNKVERCIVHEIFHGILLPLVEFAERRCDEDADLIKELHSIEDQAVTRLERMPVLQPHMKE